MRVSRAWYEDTAEDIIWEFENLLCNNDTKINNLNPEENEFENETSYINKKDYKENSKAVNRLRRLHRSSNRGSCVKMEGENVWIYKI